MTSMTVMTDAYNKLVNEDNLAGYGDPLYDQFKDQALFLAVEKRDRPLMCYLIGKGASLEVFDERDVTILDFCLERGFSIYPMPRPSWVDKDVWYSVGIRMFRQILSRPNTANQLGEILRNVPMDKLVPTFIEHIGEALDSLNIMEQLLWHGLVETLLKTRRASQIVAQYTKFIARAQPVYGALVLDAAFERAAPGSGIRQTKKIEERAPRDACHVRSTRVNVRPLAVRAPMPMPGAVIREMARRARELNISQSRHYQNYQRTPQNAVIKGFFNL
jgi:hypothetical protein